MLPTFVIGLREGLEASLIVGIIATFLGQQGRRDVMRWVWVGVGIAVALCAAVADRAADRAREPPAEAAGGAGDGHRSRGRAMVTWMIVWMRRHARGPEARSRRQDRRGAGRRLRPHARDHGVPRGAPRRLRDRGLPARRLPGLAQSRAAGTGATLGVVAAIAIGIAIYRGGLKLNMEKFFRFTGFVLVLVAAGLVATAAHTAHEAGWLNSRAAPGARPHLVGRPGFDPVGAVDRHARDPAATGHGRGARLLRLL